MNMFTLRNSAQTKELSCLYCGQITVSLQFFDTSLNVPPCAMRFPVLSYYSGCIDITPISSP